MQNDSLLKTICFSFLTLRARNLANSIEPFIPPHSSLLDIGCGNLLIAQNLKKDKHVNMLGIDVLNMNLTNLPHQLFDGKKIPLSNNQFDVSLFIGVLHHVESQLELLEETIRVTKKRIIIFEDIYTSQIELLWIKVRDIIGNLPEERRMNFALNFKTMKVWKKIFQQLNLRLTHYNSSFNPLRLTHHALFVLDLSK